jgi:hypothetical protein
MDAVMWAEHKAVLEQEIKIIRARIKTADHLEAEHSKLELDGAYSRLTKHLDARPPVDNTESNYATIRASKARLSGKVRFLGVPCTRSGTLI